MATSPQDPRVVRLADHPELTRQAGILRWKEWAYGEQDPARFIDVTAREAGDGLRLPVTLVAVDATHTALGVVSLGAADNEVSDAERAGRTPWILGMVVAREARLLGIGRRLLDELQEAAATFGHRQSWVATGEEAVGFYQRCGWAPVEQLHLASTGILTTILVKETAGPAER